MRTRSISLCLTLAALTGLSVPAAAPAATTPKAKAPTITRVTPMRLRVGSTVVIRGRNFSSRRTRNTVIFRTSNGRSAFIKPSSATTTRLVVKIPKSMARLLAPQSSRFTLRVLAGRTFSKWTPRRLSPVFVGTGTPPRPAGVAPGSGPGAVVAGCGADFDDGDLLSAAFEATIKTDPCLKDTDGDGAEDGFEFRSAVDFNNDEYQDPNLSLPYPGKRPYPNPLDPSDGGQDYDGDSLSLGIEQRLWKYSTTPSSRTLDPCSGGVATQSCVTYSDGLQHSIYSHQAGQGDRRFPALAAAAYAKDAAFVSWAGSAGYRNVYINVHHPDKPAGVYGLFDINLNGVESSVERYHFDRDASGFLSDAERDEDADGLANSDENSRRVQRSWWDACYSGEGRYYLSYADTDPDDGDSDGDGVRDGADDQDHDDVPNIMELSRIAASGFNDTESGKGECKLSKALAELFSNEDPPIYHHDAAYGRLNPFNPCLPDRRSRTCNSTVAFESPWAPFDDSVDWVSLN